MPAQVSQKKYAIAIESIGFDKGNINNRENIVAGFKGGGKWPVSFPQMHSQCQFFHNGGVDSTELSVATWIKTGR